MIITDVRFDVKSTFAGSREIAIVLITGDGSEQPLGRYFTDEKTYHKNNFIGLTVEQARKKFTDDDIAYLRR